MFYTITYKHTFGADIFFALTKRQAIKRAIKTLKEEFSPEDFPVRGICYGEQFVANDYAQLIEDVDKENIFQYIYNTYFN